MERTFIEQLQRDHLFGKAAKSAIISGNTANLLTIFSNQLGVTDGFLRNYGDPLTPYYKARPGIMIDVARINQFHTLMREDLLIGQTALITLQDQVTSITKQHHLRLESLRTQLEQLRSVFTSESLRRSSGGQWVFTEDFKETKQLNLTRSTVWTDAKSGTISLPTMDTANALRSDQLVLEEERVLNEKGSFIGTTSIDAIDGQDGTIWMVKGAGGQATWRLHKKWELNQVTLDPVGQGIIVNIEVYNEGVWSPFCSEVLYVAKTVSRSPMKAEKVRITIEPIKSSAGLRNLILWSASYSREGILYSKPYTFPLPISRTRISWIADEPGNSRVNAFVSAGASGPWLNVENGEDERLTESAYDPKLVGSFVSKKEGRTYINYLPDLALRTTDAKMEIGYNQVEISAFPYDWRILADPAHTPKSEDWTNPEFKVRTTWANTDITQTLSPSSCLIVPGNVTAINDLNFNPITQAVINGQSYLGVVLLTGSASDALLMPGNNYRFRFFIESSETQHITDGQLLFNAGIRRAGGRSYEESRRPIAGCTLLVNDEMLYSKAYPHTIFEDSLIQATSEQLVIDLKAGWNKFEILVTLADQTGSERDVDDITDPYVEVRLYPNFFDYNTRSIYNISRVVGTGNFSPLSEFDLEWNLLPDPKAWAWSTGRLTAIKTNSTPGDQTIPIDGNFLGQYPERYFFYQQGGSTSDKLYVKFELERDPLTMVGPILHNYQLYGT